MCNKRETTVKQQTQALFNNILVISQNFGLFTYIIQASFDV